MLSRKNTVTQVSGVSQYENQSASSLNCGAGAFIQTEIFLNTTQRERACYFQTKSRVCPDMCTYPFQLLYREVTKRTMMRMHDLVPLRPPWLSAPPSRNLEVARMAVVCLLKTAAL